LVEEELVPNEFAWHGGVKITQTKLKTFGASNIERKSPASTALRQRNSSEAGPGMAENVHEHYQAKSKTARLQ